MYKHKVVELSKAIEEFNSGNLLIPESFLLDTILSKCRDLLICNNYAVIKKPRTALKVKNTKGLVDLYYFILNATTNLIPYRNDKIDLSIAKALLAFIQTSTGLDRQLSLVKATNIVEGLFIYKKQLNLDPEIMTTFKVFGQDKLGWITNKIIYLLNKEQCDEAKLVTRADANTEMYVKKNNIQFGWDDLEEIANNLGDN